MKRLRFSLASLLILALTIGAGMLLYGKWPAWSLKNSWPDKEIDFSNGRFLTTHEMRRHFLSRLAKIEPGVPREAYPTVVPTLKFKKAPNALGVNEHYLAYGGDDTVIVYAIDQARPVCELEYKEGRIISAAFSEYPQAKLLVVLALGDHSEYEFVDLACGKVINRFSDKSVSDICCLLEYRNQCFFPCITKDGFLLVDTATLKQAKLPAEISDPLGRIETAELRTRNSSVLLIQGIQNSEYCNWEWDLETGATRFFRNCHSHALGDWRVRAEQTDYGAKCCLLKGEYSIELEGTIHTESKIGPRESDYITEISPDGTWVLGSDGIQNLIWDARTGKLVEKLDFEPTMFSTDSHGIFGYSNPSPGISGPRPEYQYWFWNHPSVWYGITYRIEFWLTLILSILLLLSIRKDFRSLKSRA